MGTSGISGEFEGYVITLMRPGAEGPFYGQLMAFSSTGVDGGELVPSKITFNFDGENSYAILEDATFTTATNAPMDTMYVYFKARGDADFTDVKLPMEEIPDSEGMYKITYYWEMTPSSGTPPVMGPAKTDITLEISQLRDGTIAFVTAVDNAGGNWIPGTPLPPPFPPQMQPMPDWRGRAGKKMAVA